MNPEIESFSDPITMSKVYLLRIPDRYFMTKKLLVIKFKITFWLLKMLWMDVKK